MNVAILGYGSIARDHAQAVSVLAGTATGQDLRLYGVMGPRQEPTDAFCREFGMSMATTDLDELLNDVAMDAVIVCSPSPLHAAQTERALRAGKHVLCEIPLALSLEESDRLTALATDVDRRLMVCHTQRYIPALIEARRRIAAGELHPHSLVSRYMFGRRENINWRGRRRSWTDNLLWHHGGHAVDVVLWLLGAADRGETVETVAQMALPGPDLGIPMDFGLVMRTARDQIATVAMSYHTQISLHDLAIIGEETTLLFEKGQLRDSERIIVEKTPEVASRVDSPIARQNAEFFTAIQEGREPAVSARLVRPAMAALQAVQESLNARIDILGSAAAHPRFP